MTSDRARKTDIRARMARTGESYSVAARALQSAPPERNVTETHFDVGSVLNELGVRPYSETLVDVFAGVHQSALRQVAAAFTPSSAASRVIAPAFSAAAVSQASMASSSALDGARKALFAPSFSALEAARAVAPAMSTYESPRKVMIEQGRTSGSRDDE